MFEVEAKYRIEDPARFRRLLGEGTTCRQVDVFYAHPDCDMVARDEALRWRSESSPGAPAGTPPGYMELTWKGPRQDADAKVRREENLEVRGDPGPLLAGLGYVPVHRVVKDRTTHALEGVTVVLDHVEGLGWFIEVEALGEDASAAGHRVQATAGRLGLEAPVPESYLELLLRA